MLIGYLGYFSWTYEQIELMNILSEWNSIQMSGTYCRCTADEITGGSEFLDLLLLHLDLLLGILYLTWKRYGNFLSK